MIDKHWIKRWFARSEVSKKIVTLEEEQEGAECGANRARIEREATKIRTERQVRALEAKKASIEQRVAALNPPKKAEEALPDWWSVFLGRARATPTSSALPPEVLAASAPPGAKGEASAPPTYTYRAPDVKVGPAPVRNASIFEILDVRSVSDARRHFDHLGKEAQSIAIRWWEDKEKGSLVDVTLGCKQFTADKDVAEAAWRKYHYFLGQTENQCEMLPTSTFRDVFKQVALKERSSKGGPPAADWLKSNHVIGTALDESDRCQNHSWSIVPFDFDSDGQVIFIKTDAKGNVLHDAGTREAILRKRRAEFWEDYRRLSRAGATSSGGRLTSTTPPSTSYSSSGRAWGSTARTS